MTRSKYHPIPICDDGDLCDRPATVTVTLPGFTPQGNPTHHKLCLCEACAALLRRLESQPAQYDQPTPYRTAVKGSRFA